MLHTGNLSCACANIFHKSLKGGLIGAGVLNRAGMVIGILRDLANIAEPMEILRLSVFPKSKS